MKRSEISFKYKHTGSTGDIVEVEVSTNEEILSDILERFEDFLRGCGFCFKGSLIIEEEDDFHISK